MRDISETDWKYLSSVKGELLETLCARINNEALRIITDSAFNQHDKFLRLYRHFVEKNEVVANCFDDWRRSNILPKLLSLREQRLLTEEHVSHLSAELRGRLNLM